MATQEELEARYKALLVDASDPKYCDKWHLALKEPTVSAIPTLGAATGTTPYPENT